MRQNEAKKQGLSDDGLNAGAWGRTDRPEVDLRAKSAYVQGDSRLGGAQSHLGETMSQFEDRQKGQEAKFAFDAEKKFKAEARRNKLLGLWVAELLGLSGDAANAYAAEVVAADFAKPGDEDVFEKVSGDLKAKGVNIDDAAIRAKMSQLGAVANEQVASEG